jgi:cation-transporting ATPase 13A2
VLYQSCLVLLFPFVLLVHPLRPSFLVARTEATRVLGQQKPPSRLVSSSVMVSLLGQVIIQIAFQVLVLMLILHGLPWFNELEAGGTDQQGVIDHLLFGFANFQYLSVAVAYSISRPFRRPIWTNPWYMLSLILLTASGLYLLLGPLD